MWDVFFLGTARRTESQMPEMMLGRFNDSAAGLSSCWVRIGELCKNRDHRPAAEEDRGPEDRSTRGNMCDEMVDWNICEVIFWVLVVSVGP